MTMIPKDRYYCDWEERSSITKIAELTDITEVFICNDCDDLDSDLPLVFENIARSTSPIRYVRVTPCQVWKEDAGALKVLIESDPPSFSRITELELFDVTYTDLAAFTLLMEAVATLPALKIFRISGYYFINDDQAFALSNTLFPRCPSLTELHLTGAKVYTATGLGILAAGFYHLRNLTRLSISGGCLWTGVAETFSQGLASLRCLEDLDIGYNKLEDDILVPVAKVLSELPRFCTLGVNACGLREVETLAPVIGRLRGLDLDNNPLTLEGVEILSRALTPTMKALSLGEIGIGPKGARTLAKAIEREGILLEELYLSNNYSIGDRGAATLFGALTHYGESMTILKVDGIDFGRGGCQSLARALPKMKGLAVLNVGGNDLAQGLWDVVGSIRAPLLELQIYNAGIDCEKIGILAEALIAGTLQTVTTLDIHDNNIGGRGMEVMRKAIVRRKLRFESVYSSQFWMREKYDGVIPLLMEYRGYIDGVMAVVGGKVPEGHYLPAVRALTGDGAVWLHILGFLKPVIPA